MDYKHLLSIWSEEVLTYSTVVGRVWLTVLFFFRVLMLMVGVDVLQRNRMVCNSLQPGCEESCYDTFFPVLPVHFWSAQIVIASTPTLLYLAYVMHVMYGQEVRLKGTDGKARVTVRKSVVCSYFAQLLVKIIVEVAFIVVQYFLFGFVIRQNVSCMTDPCPSRVDCFLSQATELTVFSMHILVVSCVSVALNVLEGLLLFMKLRRQSRKRDVSSSCCVDLSDKQPKNNEEAHALKQSNYFTEKSNN